MSSKKSRSGPVPKGEPQGASRTGKVKVIESIMEDSEFDPSRIPWYLPMAHVFEALGFPHKVDMPSAGKRLTWRRLLLGWQVAFALQERGRTYSLWEDPLLSYLYPQGGGGFSPEEFKASMKPDEANEEAKALYLDCIREAIVWLANRIRSIGLAPARGLFLYTSELEFGSDIMDFDPRVDSFFRIGFFRRVDGSKDTSVPIGVLVDADSNIPFAIWTDEEEIMTSLEALFGKDLPPICFSMVSQASPFFEGFGSPRRDGFPQDIRQVFRRINKTLGKRGEGGSGVVYEIVGEEDPWILFGVKTSRSQKLFGFVPHAGGRFAMESSEPKPAPEIEGFIRDIAKRTIIPTPPFRELKSDLAIEDYTYPWDEYKDWPDHDFLAHEEQEEEAPSASPFGLEVHSRVVFLAYMLFKVFQASVPSVRKMLLGSWRFRGDGISLLFTSKNGKMDFTFGINSRDPEERRWFKGLFRELDAFRDRLRDDS